MTSKLNKAGMSTLMQQQSELLDQLMVEMNKSQENQRMGSAKNNHVMGVIRGLEGRLDEAKWPARIDQRMQDLNNMMGYEEPAASQAKYPMAQAGAGRGGAMKYANGLSNAVSNSR